jgi:hypothetical protein
MFPEKILVKFVTSAEDKAELETQHELPSMKKLRKGELE